jgi:hypothetical protein
MAKVKLSQKQQPTPQEIPVPITAQDKIALAFLNLEETAECVAGMKYNIIRDADQLKAAIRAAGLSTTLEARDGEQRRVAMEPDTLERLVCVFDDLQSGLLDIQWLGETGLKDQVEDAGARFNLVIRSAKQLVEQVSGFLEEPWAKDARASLEGGGQ